MTTRHTPLPSPHADAPPGFPIADELAVLRAWYAGLPVREAVKRYQPCIGGRRQIRAWGARAYTAPAAGHRACRAS
jgi:hypothetical protein